MTKKSNIDFYNVPITDYLISIGEPIVSVGRNYYQHKDHDSLKINVQRNYFVWNSRSGEKNASGGVVQYLQIMHNLTLAEALRKVESDLTGNELKPVENKERAYPKVFNYRVSEVFVPIEAQRYLVAERKIPNRIVRHFFSIDLISQNENKEIVFKWYKGDEVVGFTKQGTQPLTEEQKEKHHTKRDYFKYVAPTTEKDTYWGFNYLIGQPKNLFFFEASIDLVSYYTLHEKELLEKGDFWLIAIDGVAIEKVLAFLGYGLKYLRLKSCLESLNVCFDNDNAGLLALGKLQETQWNGVSFTDRTPRDFEDWNEVLKKRG
ncbi:toprim domain-containing protein [Sporosarcina sp. BP05]|uniref:toprim domain-containing protein n=1 Tax=Sporosarcina sp. BP05 TaxID=2758726 RepID=UPI001647EA9B|nr:toprim domain-containing protein [Sporosarcina sp. BP05]